MAARTKKGPPPVRVEEPAKVAVPEPAWQSVAEQERVHEPLWLVRFVLVLFLIGFAAFLAREVANFRDVLP